jgi:hypothetical protein
LPIGRSQKRTVNIPSGRCEKIDFSLPSDLKPEKLRARMPYKWPLTRRYTFPFKNDTQ